VTPPRRYRVEIRQGSDPWRLICTCHDEAQARAYAGALQEYGDMRVVEAAAPAHHDTTYAADADHATKEGCVV